VTATTPLGPKTSTIAAIAVALVVVAATLSFGATRLRADADIGRDSLAATLAGTVVAVNESAAALDRSLTAGTDVDSYDTTAVLDALAAADASLVELDRPADTVDGSSVAILRDLVEAQRTYLTVLASFAAEPQRAVPADRDRVLKAYDDVANRSKDVGSPPPIDQRRNLASFVDAIISRSSAEAAELVEIDRALRAAASTTWTAQARRAAFTAVLGQITSSLDELAATEPDDDDAVYFGQIDEFIRAQDDAAVALGAHLGDLRRSDVDPAFRSAHELTMATIDGFITAIAAAPAILVDAACPSPQANPGPDDPPCPALSTHETWQAYRLDIAEGRAELIRDGGLWQQAYEAAVVAAFQ
jgi:hypothetical protein